MIVRRLFPSTVALFSLFGIVLFFSVCAQAQINAPPTSVTSPGFGGRPINGTSPSVTSVGPRGYIPKTNVAVRPPVNGNGHHNHRNNGSYYTPYLYAYPVPYGMDSGYYNDAPDANNNDDADYQGGPTVFDRRGSGARSYVPPVDNVPMPHAARQIDPADAADPAQADPQQPQAQTLLVFKDGHQLEIGNYAIVGVTLFDLTPGHPRKIPLADLDLDATQKHNEDRGVIFQVPSSLQGG